MANKISTNKAFALKKKSPFEQDVEFLVAHAVLFSDKWTEQLTYIDRSNFSKEVKREAERRLDRDN